MVSVDGISVDMDEAGRKTERETAKRAYTSARRVQRLHHGVVSEVHERRHSAIVLMQHSQHVSDAQLLSRSALHMAIHIHATYITMSVVDITQCDAPLVICRTLLLLLLLECFGARCPHSGRGSSSNERLGASLLLPIMRRGHRCR